MLATASGRRLLDLSRSREESKNQTENTEDIKSIAKPKVGVVLRKYNENHADNSRGVLPEQAVSQGNEAANWFMSQSKAHNANQASQSQSQQIVNTVAGKGRIEPYNEMLQTKVTDGRDREYGENSKRKRVKHKDTAKLLEKAEREFEKDLKREIQNRIRKTDSGVKEENQQISNGNKNESKIRTERSNQQKSTRRSELYQEPNEKSNRGTVSNSKEKIKQQKGAAAAISSHNTTSGRAKEDSNESNYMRVLLGMPKRQKTTVVEGVGKEATEMQGMEQELFDE